jgi:hypothetical protein
VRAIAKRHLAMPRATSPRRLALARALLMRRCIRRTSMSRIPFPFAFAFAGALVASAAGCMNNGTDDLATTEAAIEQPTGGLTTGDEAPMFGAEDQFQTAAIEQTAAVDDTAAADPTVTAMIAQANVAQLRVAIVWGHLPPDPTITTPTDWSGTIAVSRGALLVRHTIGFEPATDRLLPRPDVRTVAFDSRTRPFADGLALTIVDPTPAGDRLTLTYTPASGATPIVYQVADLLKGPVSVDVGSGGDRMVAAALRHDACAQGFVRGRWRAFRDGLGGFLGEVADEDGNLIGHLRGIWGVRKSGEQVFFGKYIALDGSFRGILAGHWGDDHFVGRWLDRSGDHGRVDGLYRSAPGDDGAGHFLGRWAEASCAADLPAM